ncbi:MAG: threonine synthase [Gemmatimonadota bacterium]
MTAPTIYGPGTDSPLAGATAPLPWGLRCTSCSREFAASPRAICDDCLAPLEPTPPGRITFPGRAIIESRPRSLWRYGEWLPFEGKPLLAAAVGWTPLVEAPRLAALLGVRECWLKVDAWSTPSLSFKDRVVATAINAAAAFGLEAIGCASTGNLANAVAAAAAMAGLPAWIFVPHDLEPAKLIATAVHAPNLVRVRGTYDDVNRLCAQLADALPWGLVNVNLRAYYAEGSRTMALEIAEQLGWRAPDAVVAPMAGGSLVTRLASGFRSFASAGLIDDARPRIYGAQAAGCAPIVRLFERGAGELVPERPDTIARSLAIGNPADGQRAVSVIRGSGGSAVAVDDARIVAGIRLLAASAGVFGETAAGVTVAGALELAARGHFRKSDTVVLCITGNGFKTTDAVADVLDRVPTIDPKVRSVKSLVETRLNEST